jgi:hypothetical protein
MKLMSDQMGVRREADEFGLAGGPGTTAQALQR